MKCEQQHMGLWIDSEGNIFSMSFPDFPKLFGIWDEKTDIEVIEMAKSKKILSKRSAKKLVGMLELVVVVVAVCNIVAPGSLYLFPFCFHSFL